LVVEMKKGKREKEKREVGKEEGKEEVEEEKRMIHQET